MLLTGTFSAKTRQRLATQVLLLRGAVKGEPTSCLARELGLSQKQLHTRQQDIQANLNATATTEVIAGTTFEADERYQNVGEKSTPHRDPADPQRQRGNKRKGYGTYANDRRPIISVMSWETGEQRFWVCDHMDTRTCHELIADNIPPDSMRLNADERQTYHGSHAAHATMCHGAREWARDDDGDSRHEVHCNSCAGAGAALRTYLHVFRGVHKQYLHLYMATSETMINTKRVTPQLIRRMCVADLATHIGYTRAEILTRAFVPPCWTSCLLWEGIGQTLLGSKLAGA